MFASVPAKDFASFAGGGAEGAQSIESAAPAAIYAALFAVLAAAAAEVAAEARRRGGIAVRARRAAANEQSRDSATGTRVDPQQYSVEMKERAV
jgi:hypothetical protein